MTFSKLMYAWCQLPTDSARRRRPGGWRHRFVYKYVGRRRLLRVQWGLSQWACPSTGAFLNGQRASTAGFRTLQVKPQSREAWLWLVYFIAVMCISTLFICCGIDFTRDSAFCWLAVTQNVSKYWPEGMDESKLYRCHTTETLYSNDNAAASLLTKLTMSDMLLEAFQNTTRAKFSNPGL